MPVFLVKAAKDWFRASASVPVMPPESWTVLPLTLSLLGVALSAHPASAIAAALSNASGVRMRRRGDFPMYFLLIENADGLHVGSGPVREPLPHTVCRKRVRAQLGAHHNSVT